MWTAFHRMVRQPTRSFGTEVRTSTDETRGQQPVSGLAEQSDPEPSGSENTSSHSADAGHLLVRHLEGDRQAFGELVAEYRAPVYGHLVRCGIAEEDRDDLFQDIFVKVHAAAASYQPQRPLHPWLFTIVCNTVRTYLRRLKVRKLVFRQADDEAPEVVDGQADGERQSAARQRIELLEDELQGLSETQRQVILLAGVEKLALKEIAVMLRMPVNTVKTHLRRARLALAKGLARRDQTPQVAS